MFRNFIGFSLVLLCHCQQAMGEAFLGGRPSSRLDQDKEFLAAMATVMGCGAGGAREWLPTIERALAPTWRTLPKNSDGRIEWRMLRYMVHRYFMQQSNLFIRGLEGTRMVNASHMGSADILEWQGSSLLKSALHNKHQRNGFTLHDAAIMVATLEQLVFDSESSLLETVYKQQRMFTLQRLSHKQLSGIIEAYIVHWMMDGDKRGINMLLRNRTLLEYTFPQWNAINHFAQGVAKTVKFERQRLPKPGHGQLAMTGMYSFQDVHAVVVSITKNFASFWEGQCQEVKTSLRAFDKRGTGRVTLSDFYGANLDGEWRFGESEAYLRQIGALDESSSMRGKQVIISNYVLGASNCVVATPHYLVCCTNECEAILSEVESAIGAPVATPDDVIAVVRGITDYDDRQPRLDATLEAQLRRLASIHAGYVVLHGRLFAAWMHYVFPTECPFPHKSGAANTATLNDFGNSSFATEHEVRSHAAARTKSEAIIEGVEEVQAMPQWSEEEELIADYDELRRPWDGSQSLLVGGASFVVLALLAAGGTTGLSKSGATSGPVSAFEQKSYLV